MERCLRRQEVTREAVCEWSSGLLSSCLHRIAGLNVVKQAVSELRQPQDPSRGRGVVSRWACLPLKPKFHGRKWLACVTGWRTTTTTFPMELLLEQSQMTFRYSRRRSCD
jgi:hypothetical protein